MRLNIQLATVVLCTKRFHNAIIFHLKKVSSACCLKIATELTEAWLESYFPILSSWEAKRNNHWKYAGRLLVSNKKFICDEVSVVNFRNVSETCGDFKRLAGVHVGVIYVEFASI